MKFPLTFSLQKVGLPLILTSGKLKNLCFLIDTGSTHNCLFDFVYEHFKEEFKLLEDSSGVMGIEGHYKECPTIEATFTFESADCTSTFSVLSASEAIRQIQDETGVQIHGILGIPFLTENKCVIDFENLTIKTNY